MQRTRQNPSQTKQKPSHRHETHTHTPKREKETTTKEPHDNPPPPSKKTNTKQKATPRKRRQRRFGPQEAQLRRLRREVQLRRGGLGAAWRRFGPRHGALCASGVSQHKAWVDVSSKTVGWVPVLLCFGGSGVGSLALSKKMLVGLGQRAQILVGWPMLCEMDGCVPFPSSYSTFGTAPCACTCHVFDLGEFCPPGCPFSDPLLKVGICFWLQWIYPTSKPTKNLKTT